MTVPLAPRLTAGALTIGLVTGMLLTAPGVGAQTPAPNTLKIAYVDVQRVLARSAVGVAAREQLEKDKATMQKQVDGHRGELEKLKEELDTKGQLLSADARREKQETLERKVRDVRRLVDDLQKELQKREQELLQRVLNDVSGVVQKIGKERAYSLIVEKRGASVVYGAPEIDITDEIIRAYDDEAKKAKK
jgi:outer membrane protein